MADGEGFLPVYRSNLTHPGSQHIQHSHGIGIKFQSTPEGSLGVCSLLPEEQQNSNSAWIDMCCKWRGSTIVCSCHFSQEEIRSVVENRLLQWISVRWEDCSRQETGGKEAKAMGQRGYSAASKFPPSTCGC